MTTNNCGGNWPSHNPYNGGPFPPRTWDRFIPTCPDYNEYTKDQLDMRRKAEILEYKNNRSHDTKKSRYAYLSKNGRGTLLGHKNTSIANCKTSTRSCDVPGKEMFLFLDRKVPVFGMRQIRQYANGDGRYPQKPHLLPDISEALDIKTDHNLHTAAGGSKEDWRFAAKKTALRPLPMIFI